MACTASHPRATMYNSRHDFWPHAERPELGSCRSCWVDTMMLRRTLLITVGLGLASVMLVARGSAGSRASQPTQPPITAITLGESDATILRRLPAIDLQTLIAAEIASDVPRLDQAVTRLSQHVDPASSARLDVLLSEVRLPETALLYGGDWYGERLSQAATRLGLELNADQVATLETIAVARGINARWLLLLASAKRDSLQGLSSEDWAAWLFLETWRMRSALLHVDGAAAQSIRLRDGTVVAPMTQSGPAWALFSSLSAGATFAETEQAMNTFSELYAEVFGDPALDEAQPAATVAFLYRPYTVALNGRGYFDHTYPTVDYGGQPNITGMLDYLGRTTTNYDTHDADDLWMTFGSPVLAPVAGTVLWVDSAGPDYGLLIRPPGTTYDIVIVHLSEVWPKTNTVVVRGQQIGRSGQAGGARPIPHIHVEVRHNGRQTDSRGWYGSGADPCSASGPIGQYKGCEAGVWLWADEARPGNTPTPTSLPRCPTADSTTRLPQVTPEAQLAATARLLFPLVYVSRACQSS